MARLLYTNDSYTNYSSYPTIDTVMIGSVYDPTHTSYNITLRNTPFCFFFDNANVTHLTIKDNSGPFTIDVSNTDSNFACTSIPLVGQSTELIVSDTEQGYIQVAPESIVNALYSIDTASCDDDVYCVPEESIPEFCPLMGYTETGTGTTLSSPTFNSMIESFEYNESIDISFTPLVITSLTFAGFVVLFYVCFEYIKRFLTNKPLD